MKKKKLSKKQTRTMLDSRSHRGKKFDQVKEGQVIIHRGKHVVCLANEENYKVFFNKAFIPNVGDKVRFGLTGTNQGQLLEIYDRENLLYRENLSGDRKELAVNIDLAFVMLACEPKFYPEVLSQYYSILTLQGIKCCFILNKVDICQEGLYPHQERFEYFKESQLAQSHYLSCYKGQGLDAILDVMKGKTTIVIGPSGAGKSSFVQKITDNANIKVGQLSDTGYGCHTTSVTTMYQLQGDTFLIDSPGIRQMSLESMTLKDLQVGFSDLNHLGCRFRDCDHLNSPGCKVKEDLELVEHFRYKDYCFLYNKFVMKQKDGE